MISMKFTFVGIFGMVNFGVGENGPQDEKWAPKNIQSTEAPKVLLREHFH